MLVDEEGVKESKQTVARRSEGEAEQSATEE